jgi:aryl-alcohol dehydrogenase-like predicted oxidoreductase
MRYRKLGKTGLVVSELCLGTNTFGGSGPVWENLGGLKADQATAIVKAAHEAGINFYDTADIYGMGESEQHLGHAIRALNIPRSEVVIATKVGMRMRPGVNNNGLSRAHLTDALDASLKRLGTDYVDIYMIHYPDPATPMEETFRFMDDMVRAGKIRYVGGSNYRAWEAMKAVGISERYGYPRLEIMEVHWSLVTREAERELVPMAVDTGMGMLAWGSLLGGLLTGKFTRDSKNAGGRTGGNVPPTIDRELVFKMVDALTVVAKRHNVKVSQVALAWILQKPQVTSGLFGARSPEQVADNVGATEVKLTPEDVKELEAVAPPIVVHDGTTQQAMVVADRRSYIS